MAARFNKAKEKSMSEAVLLAVTPLGLFGAQHFYLGRPHMGFLYLCTLGVLGIGYLVDIVRTPFLVRELNERIKKKNEWKKEQRAKYKKKKTPKEEGEEEEGAVEEQTEPKPFFPPREKSIIDAYLMWFPFGLFGLHHFYLKNSTWALLYMATFGLFAVGWIVDAFFIVSMVRTVNKKITDPQEQIRKKAEREKKELEKELKRQAKESGEILSVSGQEDKPKSPKKLREARSAVALGLSPFGLFGAHHYYLRRTNWGLLYTCTLGLAGFGYIWDWLRLYWLVQRSNAVNLGERSKKEKTLDDAYVLWMPWGIFGLHHFYLGRFFWGMTYLLTAGVFGIGWIMDGIRMPFLVKETNQRRVDGADKSKSDDDEHDDTVVDDDDDEVINCNITPNVDDYDDSNDTANGVRTVGEGAGQEELGSAIPGSIPENPIGNALVEDAPLPEVKLTSLEGAPSLTGGNQKVEQPVVETNKETEQLGEGHNKAEEPSAIDDALEDDKV